jgi:hypothetical protein
MEVNSTIIMVWPATWFDHILPAGSDVLGRKYRAGHCQAGSKRDHQKSQGKADGDGGHRRRAEAADPERVGQLIAGLQQIAEDDRHRESEQRAADRSVKNHVADFLVHRSARYSMTIACSPSSEPEAPRSSSSRGMEASVRIIISLKSLM